MSARVPDFSGSVAEMYEKYLVPLIFAPYAAELARRLVARPVSKVLEVAAGTGVVTRELAKSLPDGVEIVATDLAPPMLEVAKTRVTRRGIDWRQADAQALPFPDASFDTVVCQFGAMFFPDKPRAFAQARRVLEPGGVYLFSVWDSIETNDIPRVACAELAKIFPDDPPRFMERIPHGYFDAQAIARDLAAGGFRRPPRIETVTFDSRAESARVAAIAFCQGTPMRNEIESRGGIGLAGATDVVTRALERQFGEGPVTGKIQALVVTAEV